MSTYLDRLNTIQENFDNFYNLINLYNASRLNGGWSNTKDIHTGVTLSEFNEIINTNKYIPISQKVSSTFFDLPMTVRSYNKSGKYSAGIPSDIGFCRNNDEYFHEPLYKVVAETSINGKDSISGNETISYYFSNNELFVTVNGVIIKNVKPNSSYWENTEKFIITASDGANHMNMLYAFASVDPNNGGFVLYVTPNFVTWNIHQILPETTNEDEWLDLFDADYDTYSVSSLNAQIVHKALKKYFRILPNNNYVIMYPLPMYKGEDVTTMVKLYSPFNNEALLTINDPNASRDGRYYKAIVGMSCYLTENGEIILYYNDDYSPTPLILHNGRVMGTYTSDLYPSYRNEIIEYPKVAKFYNMPLDYTSGCDFKADGMAMELAVSIFDSKSADLTDSSIPAAFVSLGLGDCAKTLVTNPLDNGEIYDSVNLYVDKSIEMMDNIDVDFSKYIHGISVDGQQFRNGDTLPVDNIYNESNMGISGSWTSIAYGNGVYIATSSGSNYVGYSTDGVSWTTKNVSSTARDWSSIVFGYNRFIMVANNSKYCAYSTDGITWTEATISNTARYWNSICYGNGIYVAVGAAGYYAYSEYGDSWTEGVIDSSCYWTSICYGNDKFIIVSSDSNEYAHSTDGMTWSKGTISPYSRYWSSICYGNGAFVILCQDANIIAYSTDGEKWLEISIIDGAVRSWSNIIYGNGVYLAIAATSNIFAYSLDGIHWNIANINNNGISRNWYAIGYGHNAFIALTKTGNYYISIPLNITYPRSAIFNNTSLSIVPAIGTYRNNVRYRSTVIGNTLYDSAHKVTNNPSLGDIY